MHLMCTSFFTSDILKAMFQKIAFIGLGVLGGSLAQKIKKVAPQTKITAITRSQKTITYALKNNIIDESSTELELVIRDADLIIVATPIELIVDYVKKIHPLTKTNTIIVDIASTKELISRKLKKYSDKFIPGHPMCGSEKTGIKNSHPEMIDQAKFILTPYKNTPLNKLKKLTGFLKKLNMQPLSMTPLQHDEAVAAVSHLPYLTAIALLQLANSPAKKNTASTGFKSSTRVGDSDPAWGIDITKTNKKSILKNIIAFEKNLTTIKKLITKGQTKKLSQYLKKSQNIRRSIYQ